MAICIKYVVLRRHRLTCVLQYVQDPKNELEWPLRLKIAFDIAQGMQFLHNINPPLIHRDLKSANVLVRTSHRENISLTLALQLSSLSAYDTVVAKVGDFGVSSALLLSGLKEKANKRAVMNPTWLAPEITKARSTTHLAAAESRS